MKNYSALPFIALAIAIPAFIIGLLFTWKIWQALANINIIIFFIMGIVILFMFLLIRRRR